MGRAGWAGILSFEGGGGVVHHLRTITRTVLDSRISGGITMRTQVAGSALFGNPTVSGSCGQFSPVQHDQSCLRIGSADQDTGLKSKCRVRCPGFRFRCLETGLAF